MMLDSQLLVTADELLQRGDLRGELIMLALTPARTDAQQARLDAVRIELEEALVQEFPGTFRWRRGQLVSLTTTRAHRIHAHDALTSLEVLRVLDIGFDLVLPPLDPLPSVGRLELLELKNHRRPEQVLRRSRHLDSLVVRADTMRADWLDFFVVTDGLPRERRLITPVLEFVVRAGVTTIEVTPRDGHEGAAQQELRRLRTTLADHLAERLP